MAAKSAATGEGGAGAQFDPICGRRVTEGPVDRLCVDYKQRRYYFCSEHCQQAFTQRAERLRLAELAKAGSLLTPGKVRWGLA